VETSGGEFVVPRPGSCAPGDLTTHCIGDALGIVAPDLAAQGSAAGLQPTVGSIRAQMPVMPQNTAADPVPTTADGIGPALRPLQTDREHPGVGLVGANTEYTSGRTAEQVEQHLRQHTLRTVDGLGEVRLLADNVPGRAQIRATAAGSEGSD